MAFSDRLLDAGADIWDAQKEHPFVVELADDTLDEAAFRHWVKQDSRYLLDYARVFALAGAAAGDEETTRRLTGTAHATLAEEMDLHRSFAAEYGLSPEDLEAVQRAPTCAAYTDFLVRTAHEGSIAEIAAAVYPCGQEYLDVADHVAVLATEDHRYTPFIEKYTGEEFRETVAWTRELVDRYGEEYPGERDAMRAASLRSARLEHAFWEMCYDREEWSV